MRWIPMLVLTLVSTIVGCLERPLLNRTVDVEHRVPYRLQLEFETDVPDPYTVFSGPMETYNQFPVGAALEGLLVNLLSQQESPDSSDFAIVSFHFKALTTSFDQFGALQDGRSYLAGASRNKVLLASREGDGDGGDLPSETYRGATLLGRLKIIVGGTLSYDQPVLIEHEEMILRDNYYPSMHGYQDRFDFAPVFEQVLLMTAREVGEQVDLTLGGEN